MSNAELGTKLGDALAYVTNAQKILSYPIDINDEPGVIVDKELDNAVAILNELYTEYVKFDERK